VSLPAAINGLHQPTGGGACRDLRQVAWRRWTAFRTFATSRFVAVNRHKFLPGAMRAVTKGASRIDGLIVRHRVRAYSLVFVGMGVITLTAKMVNLPLGHDIGRTVLTDFLSRWAAGRMLLTGRGAQMYDVAAQIHVQREAIGPSRTFSLYVSPPFVAGIFAPFASLPFALSALVWAGTTVALLALAAWIFRPMLPRLKNDWGLILLVCAASEPVFELVGSGQDSALAVLLWIAGVRLAVTRREGWAGVVFALGLFKPQLFFMPPLVFLAMRRYRGLGAWMATAVSLGVVCVGGFGLVGLRSWFELLGSDLYQSEVQIGQAWRMQSLPALAQAFAPTEFGSAMGRIGLSLGLALVAICVWNARRCRDDSSKALGLWSMAIATTLLASPHVLAYDLVLLAPGAIVLIQHRNCRRVRLAILALLVLTWSSPLRHMAVSGLPWPLTVLDASWGAVPLSILWLALRESTRIPSWPCKSPRLWPTKVPTLRLT
jgi:hypothetical protein